ncbi:hypothetical protein N9Y19_04535 [Porticoccaceae bacterium]|nr:hypothetical protein [Porticoccaceae bacterium]
MPVETADDRALMIADFGESVIFMPSKLPDSTITAIFDNQYQSVEAGGTVSFAVVQPRLTVRSSDIPNAEEGDCFRIRGKLHVVTILMDDGTGITEIALEAQE